MNLALATLVILIFSLPGIAFRKSYFSGRFTSSGFTSSLYSLVFWSFLPALIFHGIFLLLVEYFTKYQISVENFGFLLFSSDDKTVLDKVFINIHDNILNVLIYNISLIIIASLLGILFRKAVRYYGLDITYSIFRFPNKWHYIFTGEYYDFSRGKKYHHNIDLIFIDVLVEVNGQGVIYSGILEDYYLSKVNDGLEQIIIKYPTKKNFSINEDQVVREIPGDFLTIPFDKILNINYSYVAIEEEKVSEKTTS